MKFSNKKSLVRHNSASNRYQIGFLKDEDKKQILRKEGQKLSRFLDNYYYPKLHTRAWFPNGKFIVKKSYEISQSGLCYFYEHGNISQLRNIWDPNEPNKKKVYKLKKDYIEYTFLKENQFLVTVEYCANCNEHFIHTHHSPELYKNYAMNIQKCIMLRFPFIKVILKPIDTDIIKDVKLSSKKRPKNGVYEPVPFINEKFKDVRIGAMEIQISRKKKDSKEIETALIHSKLKSKTWPKINDILDKIVEFMPEFKGEICLFEKQEEEELEIQNLQMEEGTELNNNEDNEEGKVEEAKNESKNIQDDKNKKNDNGNMLKPKNKLNPNIKDIKVNIYLCKNSQLQDIIKDSEEMIKSETDPKKRIQILRDQNYMLKCSMPNIRPTSALSSTMNRNQSMSSFNIGNAFTSYDHIERLNSCKSSRKPNLTLFNSCSFDKIITDKTVAESLKGKLVAQKYTDEYGKIKFSPLKFDTYFIEVEESQQYKFSGMILSFNKIEEFYINKFIGVFIQDMSFLRVLVYETMKSKGDGPKEGSDEQELVEDCKVSIKDWENESYGNNNNLFNSELGNIENKEQERVKNISMLTEVKIGLKETKDKGIFEILVKPGKYLIEVTKKNYDTVRKFIDLKKGMNSINIEMFKEKNCNLKIFVYNYNFFNNALFNDENEDDSNQNQIGEPIKNAEVTIFKNKKDILFEGITSFEGMCSYLVSKNEDFLDVVVNKFDYFPVQRTFIRKKSQEIIEGDEYCENLFILLVKKNFICQGGYTAIVTYGSKFVFEVNEENAENEEKAETSDNIKINLLNYKEKNKSRKNKNNLQVNNCNMLKKYGILTTIIKDSESKINQSSKQESKVSNSEDIQEDEEKENEYEEIVSLSYEIHSEKLQDTNYQDKGYTMNGLERYGFETLIYNPRNMFYIQAPKMCNIKYNYWHVGWIDVKNNLFFDTGVLSEKKFGRIQFFEDFVEFLQKILNKKLYLGLFDNFEFNYGVLKNNDRYIFPEDFVEQLKELNFSKKEDCILFICDMIRHSNNLESYNTFKEKISGNLKNFRIECLDESIESNRSKKNKKNLGDISEKSDTENANSIFYD